MTKIKFLLLHLFIIAVVYCAITFGGGNALLFWDIPSFLLVPIFPYLIATFIFSWKEQSKIFRLLFDTQINKKNEDINNALGFLDLLQRLIVLTSILGFILGLICMFVNLPDNSVVGKYFGLALLTVFYGCYFIIGFIVPFKAILNKKYRIVL